MYKVDLPVDESALQAVERRRAAEAERKSRIFNPRARVIGVDLRVLQKQQEEKRERLDMDQQRDMARGKTHHFCSLLVSHNFCTTCVLQNKLQR